MEEMRIKGAKKNLPKINENQRMGSETKEKTADQSLHAGNRNKQNHSCTNRIYIIGLKYSSGSE